MTSSDTSSSTCLESHTTRSLPTPSICSPSGVCSQRGEEGRRGVLSTDDASSSAVACAGRERMADCVPGENTFDDDLPGAVHRLEYAYSASVRTLSSASSAALPSILERSFTSARDRRLALASGVSAETAAYRTSATSSSMHLATCRSASLSPFGATALSPHTAAARICASSSHAALQKAAIAPLSPFSHAEAMARTAARRTLGEGFDMPVMTRETTLRSPRATRSARAVKHATCTAAASERSRHNSTASTAAVCPRSATFCIAPSAATLTPVLFVLFESLALITTESRCIVSASPFIATVLIASTIDSRAPSWQLCRADMTPAMASLSPRLHTFGRASIAAPRT
mmetsp:Transcript_22154/g.54578  ORF Transcript_22154/g.54578 Transcript_22154/m.54578 type:complete len:345 (-) Transcript_22154:236-1270(-)